MASTTVLLPAAVAASRRLMSIVVAFVIPLLFGVVTVAAAGGATYGHMSIGRRDAVSSFGHHGGLTTASPSVAPNASFLAAHFTGYAAARRGPTPTDVLWQQGFGSMDARGRSPMPLNPRYPIASNSKLITAVALYQLQERGLVNLELPVQLYLTAADMAAFGQPGKSNWCPQVRGSNDTTCRNVTFVQLMEMQAGIPNRGLMQAFYPYPGSIGAVFSYYVDEPLVSEPGTRYYYSNPAFILCGYFIEKFSGMRLADYYSRYIFDVVGMSDTYFDVFNGQLSYDPLRIDEFNTFVDPVSGFAAQGACTSEADLGFAGAAGGIMGTPLDEAKLYYALFNFSDAAMGKPLLQDPRSLLAIVKPRTPLIPGIYYGQGLYVEAANAHVAIPTLVMYEGDMACPRTSNYFAVEPPSSNTVPLMTQAWSSGVTYFVPQAEWMAATGRQLGVVMDIVTNWTRREGNNALAMGLMKAFQN